MLIISCEIINILNFYCMINKHKWNALCSLFWKFSLSSFFNETLTFNETSFMSINGSIFTHLALTHLFKIIEVKLFKLYFSIRHSNELQRKHTKKLGSWVFGLTRICHSNVLHMINIMTKKTTKLFFHVSVIQHCSMNECIDFWPKNVGVHHRPL